MDSKQTSLTSFFSPTKPRPVIPKRTHKIKISDSKTRASGTLPRESDTTAGQLQVMLYKELFDAMLRAGDSEFESDSESRVSNVTMSFDRVFTHLGLQPAEPFSEAFIKQSRPIVTGNMLGFETGSARNLGDMVIVWKQYVSALGLGTSKEGEGRSEDNLELVYRRAGGRKGKGKGKGKSGRKRKAVTVAPCSSVDEEDRELQLAIELSLQTGDTVLDAAETSSKSNSKEEVVFNVTEKAVSFSYPDTSNAGSSMEQVPIAVDEATSQDHIIEPTSNTEQVSEGENNKLSTSIPASATVTVEVPALLQEAVAYLHPTNPPPMTEEEREREEDAIALEVELSYRKTGEIQDPGEMIPIRASQDPTSPLKSTNTMDVDMDMNMGMIEDPQSDPEDPKSGGIIGRHRFKYDSKSLQRHLESVMSYWHGTRQPSGVDINNTKRCVWCEFEDGCEWRYASVFFRGS